MSNIHNKSTSRITSQQQAVFQVIKKNAQHVTADQVYKEVNKVLPRISLATVYRNLEKLADQKLIGRVVINGVYYFEMELHEHYHVVCHSCRRVENIDSNPASDIEEFFSRSTPFKLTNHDLTLYGICPTCQKNRK